MTDYYQIAQTLAAALPLQNGDFSSTARNALVSRLKGATPGSHTQPWPRSSGPSFRSLFFPNYSPAKYEDQVSSILGFDNNWWSSFSVAALCQTMYQITSSLRPQLLIDNINATVNDKNNNLHTVAYKWYGFVLTQEFTPYKNALVAASDKNQLAQTYSDYLNTDAWVLAKKTQHVEGHWTNQDWELFNHWIKLMELGQTIDTINNLINNLKAKGLPVPQIVDAGQWVNYLGWINPNFIDWNDLKAEASSGILAEECEVYPGSYMPSCMKEENSFEFTANSQPGNPYRQPPSGSCFTSRTKVLMGDGSIKAISAVKVGDEVRTPKGTAKVNIVATPPRAGRKLVSINDLNFGFTETHPWMTFSGVSQKQSPLFAAAHPLALMDSVPYFSPWGISALESSEVAIAGFSTQEGLQAVNVKKITDYLSTDDTDTLYDLIVEMDADGISEYIIGDESDFFVVSSEVPRLETDPLAAFVIATLLVESWSIIQQTVLSKSEGQYSSTLFHAFHTISSNLISKSIEYIQGNTLQKLEVNTALLTSPEAALQELATSFMDLSTDGEPQYNQEKGYAFEILMRIFGNEVKEILALGWRKMTEVSQDIATILAISVHSLELFGTEKISKNENLKVVLSLQHDQHAEERSTVSDSGRSVPGYYYAFSEVLYFASWRSESSSDIKQPWTLNLDFLLGSQDISLPLIAHIYLPKFVRNSYRRMYLSVLNPYQEKVGRLSLDLRLLNPELMAQELAAKKTWTEGDTQELALGIAHIAANLLKENLSFCLSRTVR